MATHGEPRYTIEQIELLRRLMRTGLTKQDIIHALDTMTKLDSELCQGTSTSVQSAQPHMQQQQQQQQQPIHTQQIQIGRSPPSFVTSSSATPAVNQLMTAVHQVTGNRQPTGQPGFIRTSSEQSDNGELKCGFENFDVADEEVNELFRRGTMPVKEDIKNFLAKHHITQNQISHATGISQSYISQFLLHGFIMRQSTQALFYKWYLGKMKEMDMLEKEMGGSIEPSRQRDMYPGKNAHLIPPIRRRERFSWNEACLKVLESYWKKNPYPNDVEREKITDACNMAQQMPGEALVESRLVTPAKVYNWFANRRKDANRRKRMSGDNSGTESTIVTLTEEGDSDTSQPNILHQIQEVHEVHIQESEPTTVTIHRHQRQQPDQQQQHPQQQPVPVELEAVNSSIITLMQAVEEKNQTEAEKS